LFEKSPIDFTQFPIFLTLNPGLRSPTMSTPVKPKRRRRRPPSAAAPRQVYPQQSIGSNVAVAVSPRTPAQFTVVETIQRPDPKWLPLVMVLKKVSTPVAVASILCVLPLYGVSVHLQREWGNQYAKLETLQSQEQALLTDVEQQHYTIPLGLVSKPQGYGPVTPNNTLFLTPAKPRSLKAADVNSTGRQTTVIPSGY
jgi:hypothetical protein